MIGERSAEAGPGEVSAQVELAPGMGPASRSNPRVFLGPRREVARPYRTARLATGSKEMSGSHKYKVPPGVVATVEEAGPVGIAMGPTADGRGQGFHCPPGFVVGAYLDFLDFRWAPRWI